jgi:hypothetical protein
MQQRFAPLLLVSDAWTGGKFARLATLEMGKRTVESGGEAEFARPFHLFPQVVIVAESA